MYNGDKYANYLSKSGALPPGSVFVGREDLVAFFCHLADGKMRYYWCIAQLSFDESDCGPRGPFKTLEDAKEDVLSVRGKPVSSRL